MTAIKRTAATIGATAVLLTTSTGAAFAGPDDSFSKNLSTCSIEGTKAFPKSNYAFFGFVAGCMASGGY